MREGLSQLVGRTLWSGGPEVSQVGLGGSALGVLVDGRQGDELLEVALERGVNFFDTADCYGFGKSEEFLGKRLGSRREEVVLSTKFGMPASRSLADEGWVIADRQYIQKALEGSLRRLKVEYIDIYWYHTPDRVTDIREVLETLESLRLCGRIGAYGCCNMTVEELRDARSAATEMGIAGFVSSQSEYSLVNRSIEGSMSGELERGGLSLIPYRPLAGGLLSRPSGRVSEHGRSVLERLERVASSWGFSLSGLAVAWLLSRKCVTSVIAGTTSVSHLIRNIEAAEVVVPTELLQQVDAVVSPGSGPGYARFVVQ